MGALFTSCDLDQQPRGTINDNSELNLEDVTKLRTGLYAGFRGATTGSYITIPDLMADQFNGTISNGNRNGSVANGTQTSSTGEFESLYNGCYGGITSCNYTIEQVEKLINSGLYTGEDLLMLNTYLGEAKFFRAYRYWYLFDHFCQKYSDDKAKTPALGLSLQTKYMPGGNTANYPGRSTMEETITLIKTDLADAYTALVAYEQLNSENKAPSANYLSSDVVKALEARICLNLGDYDGAIAAAEPIVTANTYPLSPASDYENLWSNDYGSELLFVPFANANEGGGVSVYNTYNNVQADETADYLPSQDVLLSYEEGDARFDAFFKGKQLKMETVNYLTFIFYKWPGNEALGAGRLNAAKPFRASELYLILAEAYAEQGKNPDKGLGYLNDLRKARFVPEYYEELALHGDALKKAVREERALELIGEGFRFTDLKRYGEGFSRDVDYSVIDQVADNATPLENAMSVLGGRVKYIADDYRYTWPIPASEIDINPQLVGQQNPGY